MRKIEILPSATSLYKAAAIKILELYDASIKQKGNFTIALSGGNTPKKLYELLATTAFSKKINWKNVFVFWGDERYVPFSDEENNSHMASIALLDEVPIPTENVFKVPVNFTVVKAAAQYEQIIKRFFKEALPSFDLIMLGVGEDGHTASLFPNNEILQENKRLVKQVYLAETDTYRISFTIPLINNAKNLLFLISGKEKSAILAKLFKRSGGSKKFPVQLIKPINGNTYWYIDKAAASQLNK